MTYIYILIDPITNEIRYVGKTNNPTQRLKNHKNSARDKNTHKRNWINKLKKSNYSPDFEIIDKVKQEEWKYWEKFWICYFKYIGANLLNYTVGGDGLSIGNRTSFKKGENKKPVLEININKQIVKEYESHTSTEYSRHLINRKKLTRFDTILIFKTIWENLDCIAKNEYIKESLDEKQKRKERKVQNGKINGFKKLTLPWNKNKIGTYSLKGKKRKQPVLQFTKDMKFVKEFDSCKDAAKEMNCIAENIRRCCVKKAKTAKHYIWFYKKDYKYGQK